MIDLLPTPSAWTCVNDPVMGGQSTSRVTQSESGVLMFAGTVSLANNGGFASTRAPLHADLSASVGLALRVHGLPRRYRLTLRTEPGGRTSYRIPFWTTPQPATHCLPFERMKPMRRGQPRPDAPPFEAAQVCEVGFLIGNGQAGNFDLHVHSMASYQVDAPGYQG